MFLQLLLLFSALIISLHLYLRYNRGARLISKINGPQQMFLFGNLFDIFLTPEKMFVNQIEWRKQYGRLWRLCAFNYRGIYLYEPKDVEFILSSTQILDKDMPYKFLYPWLRQGLLTSTGEKWLHRRKLLTPAFHFFILKKFFRTFCERSQDLMKTIEKEVGKEKTDLAPIISRSTLSVICETSMGTSTHEDIDSLTDKYLKPLYTLSKTVIYRVTRLWLFQDFIFNLTQVAKIQEASLKTLHKFTTEIIQGRREFREKNNIPVFGNDNDGIYGKNKMAMLDLLLDEEKKGRIDEEGIREEVDTFMFEGHDTTATAITFMIMRIANEPDIQNSIYEEMYSIFGDSNRTPTTDDLNQMKYLECCVKESLRLYPAVPFISRYLKEEIEIAGQLVPRNTLCNIYVYDIHRNPAVFPEPEKFIPERFLPENCATRHPYAYIPFSAGPRNCIGQKFALMEIKTVMSSLLRRFRLEPITKPEDIVFMSDIVLRANHPIYVRFCNRDNKVY